MQVQGYHNNPRRISEADLKSLEKSMLQFGDLSGIVINKGTFTGREMELVGGNVRAGRLGLTTTLNIIWGEEIENPIENGTLAVGYVLHPETGERFNVRLVDWSQEMCDAANIAANAEGGKFDFEVLSKNFPENLTARVFEKFGGFAQKQQAPIIDTEASIFQTSLLPKNEAPATLETPEEVFHFGQEEEPTELNLTEVKPSDVNPIHIALSATDVAQIANKLLFLKEYHNIESNSELFTFLVEQWYMIVKPEKNEV